MERKRKRKSKVYTLQSCSVVAGELNQICASSGEPRQFWGEQIAELTGYRPLQAGYVGM